jgi:hypothetical protein
MIKLAAGEHLGTYKVREFLTDRSLTLDAHDDYWGGQPPIKSVRLVAVPEIEASEGDDLHIGADAVVNGRTGKRFRVVPLPPARAGIVEAGGLVPYTRSRLLERTQAP